MPRPVLIWIGFCGKLLERGWSLTELKNNSTLWLFLPFIVAEVCSGMGRVHVELRHTNFTQVVSRFHLFYLKQKDA